MLARIADWQSFLDSALDEPQVNALRRHTRTGRPLGSPKFLDHLETHLGRPLRPKKPGRRKRFA